MTACSPFKSDFLGLEEKTYLNTGAEGIPLKSCSQAMAAYIRAKACGAAGRSQLYETASKCKASLARLLDATPDEVAVLANASEGINRLCNALHWSPGDEIVISDLEFPSNVLPWLRLREAGVRVKILRSRNWMLSPEDLASAVNGRTRLVCVSHVSYLSGSRLDIAAFGEIAHRAGALFAVDATQSLGRIEVPLENVDYLVASTYKWLLSPHGGGVVYCRGPLLDQLNPSAIGWWSVRDIFTEERFESYRLKPDAARLESGMPSFAVLYAVLDAVEYLNRVGIRRIECALRPVCDCLVDALTRLPVRLMTPTPSEMRAGIVSFLHPDCERIARELERDGIHVWGGDGRVRVSIHLYNDGNDVELLLGKLAPLIA